MSLELKIAALITAVGGDVKALTTKIGDTTSLSTTAKANLVAAINEVQAAVVVAAGAGAAAAAAVVVAGADAFWVADMMVSSFGACS